MRISQPLLRTCYYTAFRLKYNKFLCRVQYYTIRVQDKKRDHRTAVYYSNAASQATSGTKYAIILKVPIDSKRKTIGTH